MRIADPAPFEYPFTDLSALRQRGRGGIREHSRADARTAFDLVAGPCVRAHLVKLAPDRHAFMLTAHHIICDGWSMNVIVSELGDFMHLCAAVLSRSSLMPCPSAVYARDQAARALQELAATEAYWLDQFANPPSVLELPTDRPRPSTSPSTARVSAAASMQAVSGGQEDRRSSRQHPVRHLARRLSRPSWAVSRTRTRSWWAYRRPANRCWRIRSWLAIASTSCPFAASGPATRVSDYLSRRPSVSRRL
jgi:hypothetical protein